MTEHATTPAFIGVDWGTSNARFMLIGCDGTVIEERSGVGIGALADVAAIEAEARVGVSGWSDAQPALTILMCGMVGSNMGWRTAPYVATPTDVAALGHNVLEFAHDGHRCFIVPGVETVRRDGAPDMMRGEETQIIGATGAASGLACLPGTHCKWARVEAGRITGFHTALTGELMALIGAHSILLNPREAPRAADSHAFREGVIAAQANSAGLESLLFTVRSKQIKGTLAPEQAGDYLAGLCIGADLKSALVLSAAPELVTVIGAPALTDLYQSALRLFGRESDTVDGSDAVVRGLTRIYTEWLRS